MLRLKEFKIVGIKLRLSNSLRKETGDCSP